jgi:16S rRNA (cytidine1402-2'-O)-methyltransferase
MPGTLFVVATPIGNLEDISLRALRVLREVDLVACEDTRQTAKLLSHYQISKSRTSYHQHNEIEKAALLLEQLQSGKLIALVCDSGTPCISDPGYCIVRSALENGIKVVPIPGPCSFIAALSASGRPTDSFTFLGFLPSKRKARRTLLQTLKEEPRTLIFFESPGRLVESLNDIHEVIGIRPMTIARELTKLYEELFFGTALEAYDYFTGKSVKGEITIIMEKTTSEPVPLSFQKIADLERKMDELVATQRISKNEALKLLSHELNIPKRELYRLILANQKSS